MSAVDKPALATLDELAAFTECDLKLFVSMPALFKIEIIHLMMVGFDTGLWGDAKLSHSIFLVSVPRFFRQGFVISGSASIHFTRQRASFSGEE